MSVVSTGTEIISKHLPQAVKGRFSTAEGRVARSLNKIAIKAQKAERMTYTFSKATPADLERLTSKKIEDSYKRVTWTNPKDNKVYHILEEGRENGKINVRILDKDGAFLKNAQLEPKNIVVFDTFYSPRGVTHGEMMETFVKRFNPFANVERLPYKKNIYEMIRYHGRSPLHLFLERFVDLEQKMAQGKKVDFISISETHMLDIAKVKGEKGAIQKEYVNRSPFVEVFRPVYRGIIEKGARILESAGNDTRNATTQVFDQLAIDGVEGVGSLVRGKIAKDSCSRNSVFTQHYEQRNFKAVPVHDENGKAIGVSVTGLGGVDLPLTWKTKKLIGRHFGGTSYSTPIRVAKLSLNDMMKDII